VILIGITSPFVKNWTLRPEFTRRIGVICGSTGLTLDKSSIRSRLFQHALSDYTGYRGKNPARHGPSSNIQFTQEELAAGPDLKKRGQKPLGGHQFMFAPSTGFFVLRRRKAVLLEIFFFEFFAPSAFVHRSQNYGGQDGATSL
jgi:hypothetical protein